MRTRLFVQVLSLVVIVAAGAVWLNARATAAGLQARLAALADRNNAAGRLLQERDRLRSALAEAALRREAAATAMTPATVPAAPPPAVGASWPLGEWRSSREWRNEGQATARGTVATLLWAAAGGDLATTTRIIVYDETGRQQAQALFDRLSPADRQAFPTPEALVAGLTIQAVPTDAAQLSWFHQRDADHATVGLLLGAPEQTDPAEARVMPAQDNNPPMLLDRSATQLTVLSLQRSAQGWRVIIPAAAIERLGQRSKPPTG